MNIIALQNKAPRNHQRSQEVLGEKNPIDHRRELFPA